MDLDSSHNFFFDAVFIKSFYLDKRTDPHYKSQIHPVGLNISLEHG